MKKIIPIIIALLITLTSATAYKTTIYYEKGTDITTYQEVIKFIPPTCGIRIDIVNRNNAYYNGYAWYAGRITIYDGNHMDTETKVYTLEHEIGHLCNINNRAGSYEQREINADNYIDEQFQ